MKSIKWNKNWYKWRIENLSTQTGLNVDNDNDELREKVRCLESIKSRIDIYWCRGKNNDLIKILVKLVEHMLPTKLNTLELINSYVKRLSNIDMIRMHLMMQEMQLVSLKI